MRTLTVLVAGLSTLLAAGALLVTGNRPEAAQAAGVDPRSGGFTVGMGEWSVAPESKALRPGRVTLVVTNNGRYVHGFRIRSTEDEDESGGDRFEYRTRDLRPGETLRVTLTLPAGTYDFECFVEDRHGDHESRGMHAFVEVRADAPLVARARASGNTVRVEGFAFKAPTVRVQKGTTVRWVNRDAAPHSVAAQNGSFASRNLRQGQSYARRFTRPGSYEYLCGVHPQMKGRVVVR
jgi:amicyanin